MRLASLSEAARYAGGLSPATVRRYISEGRLRGYRCGPRLVRVDLDALDAMLEPLPAERAA